MPDPAAVSTRYDITGDAHGWTIRVTPEAFVDTLAVLADRMTRGQWLMLRSECAELADCDPEEGREVRAAIAGSLRTFLAPVGAPLAPPHVLDTPGVVVPAADLEGFLLRLFMARAGAAAIAGGSVHQW